MDFELEPVPAGSDPTPCSGTGGKSILALNIRELRLTARFPICALADYLGVSLVDYIDLEEGRRDVIPVEEIMLSNLYGLEDGALYSFDALKLSLFGKRVEELSGEDLNRVALMVSDFRKAHMCSREPEDDFVEPEVLNENGIPSFEA